MVTTHSSNTRDHHMEVGLLNAETIEKDKLGTHIRIRRKN